MIVTPTLSIGSAEHADALPVPATFCADVATAVMVIIGGGLAVVPDDNVAAAVLRSLGCSDDWVDNRLAYAHRQGAEPVPS